MYKYSIMQDREFYQSKLVLEGKQNLRQQGKGKRPNAASWQANILDSKNYRRFQSSTCNSFSDDMVGRNWGQQMLRGSLFSGDRPRKWKVAEQLRWWKWKEALGAIAHYQPNSTYNNIKQIPRIFSVVFSNQYRTDPASSSYHAFTVTISTTVKSRLVSFNDSAVHPKSSDQH